MLGLITGILGGAVAPLVDRMTEIGARFVRKLALFAVAGVCLVVVILSLTIAFDLWIATLAGPIVGALAVALLYFVIGAAAVVVALRGSPRPAPSASAQGAASANPELDEQIDRFTSPLMGLLGSLGLRREQLAVLAGGSLAKKIGPIPLVGLAIVAGFLIGRTFKMWRDLVSIETLTSLLAAAGLFGFGAPPEDEPDEA